MKNPTALRLWLAALAVSCVQAAAQLPEEEARSTRVSDAEAVPPSPSQLSGSRADRDPETGRLIAPAPVPPLLPEVAASRARLATLSRLRASLREEPAPSAAGGVRVRLGSAFRSELIAIKDPDGTIQFQCLEEAPETAASEAPTPEGGAAEPRSPEPPATRPATAPSEEGRD